MRSVGKLLYVISVFIMENTTILYKAKWMYRIGFLHKEVHKFLDNDKSYAHTEFLSAIRINYFYKGIY